MSTPKKDKEEALSSDSEREIDKRAIFNSSDKRAVFNCSMCGECCTSITVPIKKEKAYALLEKDWVQKRLKEANRDFEAIDDEHYRMPLNDESVCVFLGDEDKKCMIHGQEGEDMKPTECIRFPFAAIKMPCSSDGEQEAHELQYDVSASCKTVATELLTEFLPIVPNASFAKSFEADSGILAHEELFPHEISAGFLKKLDSTAYKPYQKALATLFKDDPTASPELLLKQVSQTINALPKEAPKLAKTFKFWRIWHSLILYLSLRRPYGIMDQLAVLLEGSYSDPKVFGMGSIQLKGHKNLAWDAEKLNPMMNGYLYALLQRKLLLAFGHSLPGVLLIAVHGYFLVQWYARTLALVQEKDEVEAEDLATAIRVVERYYTGHQPYFLEFFRVLPGIRFYLWVLMGF